MDMGDYGVFKEKVFQLTKIDLNSYKERQMRRRIDSLISKAKVQNYAQYVEALRTNDTMLEEFVAYLTINVSEFYRNPEQWGLMEKKVLPYLFDKFGKNIKIWSAACSTGDEPYTLVMVLAKFLPLDKIQVIATDIDKQVLEKAQLGIYNEKSLKGLPAEFKAKYFTKINNSSFQVKDEIKKCVQFQQHNLLKDPYPSGCNLIVCRNVMIYFTEEAKNIMYHKFNDSLKNEGILFVGSTEQIINPSEYNFTTVQSFFYKKGAGR